MVADFSLVLCFNWHKTNPKTNSLNKPWQFGENVLILFVASDKLFLFLKP